MNEKAAYELSGRTGHFHSGDQRNQRRFHIVKLSDTSELHVYETQADALAASRERVQSVLESSRHCGCGQEPNLEHNSGQLPRRWAYQSLTRIKSLPNGLLRLGIWL